MKLNFVLIVIFAYQIILPEQLNMAGILVAYDDPIVRLGLKQLFEHAQHRVAEVESKADAMKLLKSFPAELFITELQDPDAPKDAEVEDFINQFPKMKMILTTSSQIARTAWLPVAEKLGQVRVMRRPFGNDQILNAVSELLKKNE